MTHYVTFEGFDTETVGVAAARILNFSGLTVYSSRGGDAPAVSITLDNESKVLVRGTVASVRKALNAGVAAANAIVRAFAIADESMFELLLAHCVAVDEHKTVLGLVDEAGGEVRSLIEADPNIVEAFEWLRPRGYVGLAEDANGEHLLVVRRPGEE